MQSRASRLLLVRLALLLVVLILLLSASLTKDGMGKGKTDIDVKLSSWSHEYVFNNGTTEDVGLWYSKGLGIKKQFELSGCTTVEGLMTALRVFFCVMVSCVVTGIAMTLVLLFKDFGTGCWAVACFAVDIVSGLAMFGWLLCFFIMWFSDDYCSLWIKGDLYTFDNMSPSHLWDLSYAVFLYGFSTIPYSIAALLILVQQSHRNVAKNQQKQELPIVTDAEGVILAFHPPVCATNYGGAIHTTK